MRALTVSLLLFGGAALGWAADEPTAAQKEELKKLEGTWVVTAGETRGKQRAEADVKGARVVIAGDTATFEQDGKPEKGKA
jgi:hypothetical protein